MNDAITVILQRLEEIEKRLPDRIEQGARAWNPPRRPNNPRTWLNSNLRRGGSYVQNRGVRPMRAGTRYNDSNHNSNLNRGRGGETEIRLDPETFELSRNIFKHVQLQHHADNWCHLPNKFEQQIDAIFEWIRLPMPSEELLATLRSMSNKWKAELQEAAHDHVIDRQRAVEVNLSASKPSLLEQAASVARNRLQRHFRGKMNTEQMDYRMGLASKMIMNNRDESQSEISENIAPEAETIQNSMEWNLVAGGARKRKPEGNSPIPLNNSFAALLNIQEDNGLEVVDIPSRAERVSIRNPKKSKTSKDDIRDVPEIINHSINLQSTSKNIIRDVEKSLPNNRLTTSVDDVRDVEKNQSSNGLSTSVDNVRDVTGHRSSSQYSTSVDDVRDVEGSIHEVNTVRSRAQ